MAVRVLATAGLLSVMLTRLYPSYLRWCAMATAVSFGWCWLRRTLRLLDPISASIWLSWLHFFSSFSSFLLRWLQGVAMAEGRGWQRCCNCGYRGRGGSIYWLGKDQRERVRRDVSGEAAGGGLFIARREAGGPDSTAIDADGRLACASLLLWWLA